MQVFGPREHAHGIRGQSFRWSRGKAVSQTRLRHLIIVLSLTLKYIILTLPRWSHLFYSYKNDPEILAMTNLIAAYQRNEILEFETFLRYFNGLTS